MGEKWLSMDDAPKGRTVRVKLTSGKILDAHFAQDLSGEDQPPFKGWFTQRSKTHPEYGFVQIDEPVGWKPVKGKSE
jgi:hypothetical protein